MTQWSTPNQIHRTMAKPTHSIHHARSIHNPNTTARSTHTTHVKHNPMAGHPTNPPTRDPPRPRSLAVARSKHQSTHRTDPTHPRYSTIATRPSPHPNPTTPSLHLTTRRSPTQTHRTTTRSHAHATRSHKDPLHNSTQEDPNHNMSTRRPRTRPPQPRSTHHKTSQPNRTTTIGKPKDPHHQPHTKTTNNDPTQTQPPTSTRHNNEHSQYTAPPISPTHSKREDLHSPVQNANP